MSVLFVMPTWSAPSEVWMQRMLEALAQDLAYVASERVGERLWRGRVPTIELKTPRSIFARGLRRLGFELDAPGKRLLTRAVQSSRVNCILVHYLNFALRYETVWNRTGKPLFVHCHGYDVTWNWRPHDKLYGKPFWGEDYPGAVRRMAERALLIANSRCTAKKLRDIGVPPDRITIHNYGVPSPQAPPERPARRLESTVLFLGRLVDFKGPDLVIKAFELVCERGFKGRLIIAGDGPLGPMCELMRVRSKYSNRIQLLGAVDRTQAAALRFKADIFTAHSCLGPVSRQEEAFGVAFAEAMADALPVVTGRSGGLPELVEDGVTGVLFEPGDVEGHANGLLKLASDPESRLQMGRAAWQRARTLFPPENDTVQLRSILGLLHGGNSDGIAKTGRLITVGC